MSALVTNQAQMRAKIFSGSPKKKAAWLSPANRKCGNRPGVVSRCHSTKRPTSRDSCQPRNASLLMRAPSCGQLLLIALEHLVAQHLPDGLVQFDEARRGAHLGHVARAIEVDAELAD